MKKQMVRCLGLSTLFAIALPCLGPAEDAFRDFLKKDQQEMTDFKAGKSKAKPKPEAEQPKAPGRTAEDALRATDWLIMVYMAADNNLDPAAMTDLAEMQTVGSSATIKIVALCDRASSGEWTGARRFLVCKPSDQGGKNSWDPSLATCKDLGELNTGDPQVLRAFVTEARREFPARQNMLVLWNHGGGWRDSLSRAVARSGRAKPVSPGLGLLSRGVCWDDSNGNDFLETREVRAALEGLPKLSILGADACLMAMIEVAYEWRGAAEFLVASEHTEPNNGWPYDTILKSLAANPGVAPRQLASDIVRLYGASYPPAETATQSAVDLARVEALAQAVDQFGVRMSGFLGGGGTLPAEFKQYFANYVIPGNPFVDLDGMLEVAEKSGGFPADLKAAAAQGRQAFKGAVVANFCPLPVGRGLMIYGGFTSELPDYSGSIIQFARDTRWDECLTQVLAAIEGGGSGGGGSGGGAAQADWLFLVYMAADNNLDPAAPLDLAEMQKIGSSDRVKIVCLTDRAASAEWTGARRFLVLKDAELGGKMSWDPSLPTCKDLGEVNTGDPAVLKDFLTWARATYPAKNVLIDFWNHGGGWRDAMSKASARAARGQSPNIGLARLARGVCWDDTNGSDFLESREVRQVLEGMPKVAILGADACLMAMIEVAYEWRASADVLVASENFEPGNGWPYDKFLGVLAANPAIEPRAFAAEMVKIHDKAYPPAENATLSAIDLGKTPAAVTAFQQVAGRLGAFLTGGGALPADLKQYFATYVFPDNPYLDLDGLLEVVNKSSALPADLRGAAVQARQAAAAALIANSSPLPAGRGIAIYGAFTGEFAEYNKDIILFARDTLWDECLKLIVPAVQQSPAKAVGKTAPAEWLIMVYQAADNNLDPFAILDLKEMQQVGSSDKIKIVSMTDRASFGDWTTTRRFLVSKPADQGGKDSWDTSLPTCEDMGEVNMGQSETLRGFVKWATARYPAARTALVIWNHGGGWRDARQGKSNPLARGIAWDDTDNGDFLESREVRTALDGHPKLALIGADACLMGMVEVAYEWRGVGDVLVASEEIEPGDGWPYETVLGRLAEKPELDARAFAAEIVRLYAKSYANQAVTLSAVDLGKVEPLVRAVDAWAGALIKVVGDGGALPEDFFQVPGYPRGSEEFRDLDALAEKSAAVAGAAPAAAAVRKALADALLANYSDPALGGRGLSIYPGGGRDDADYNGDIILFARNTRWDDFLTAARKRTGGAASGAAAARAVAGPDRWAVLIGVKDYRDSAIPDLKYSVNDVEKLREALIKGNGYDPQHVIVLTDKDATTERVRSVLGTELPRQVKKDDLVMIYFSGHGAAEPSPRGDPADGTEKYLLFADSKMDNMYGTALPMSEIARILGRLPSAKVLLLMDTCYSGAAKVRGGIDETVAVKTFTGEGAPSARLSDDYLNRLAGSEGVVVITASRAGEQSMESPRFSMGVFSYYLLQVFLGKADANGDGVTALAEAFAYLHDHVTQETKQMGVTQRPVMKGEVSGDFPVAVTPK